MATANQGLQDPVAEQLWKPVARARQLWATRRALLADMELTSEEHRAVVKAVRRSAVYRAVVVNVDAVARSSGRTALLALVLAIVFTAVARPSGAADIFSTLAGVLVGVVLCLLPVAVLLEGMDRLTVRWPGVGSAATTGIWSMMVLGASLAGVHGAGSPAGFLTGLAWGPAAFVLAAAAGETSLMWAGLRWGKDYRNKALPAAVAAELLLMAVGKLSGERRAWRTASASSALADALLRHAQRVEPAFRQLACGRGWRPGARANRDEIRVICPRVRHAVLEYRRGMLNATSQREYDELVDRAKQHLVAVANQQWDALPACSQGHVGQAAVATVFTAAVLGLTVNAASEHLPEFMDKSVAAWASVAVSTVVAVLLQLRRR